MSKEIIYNNLHFRRKIIKGNSIKLKISTSGAVISHPAYINDEVLLSFIESKWDWVQIHSPKFESGPDIFDRKEVSILGKVYKLDLHKSPTAKTSCRLDVVDHKLHVFAPANKFDQKDYILELLRKKLIAIARDYCLKYTRDYSALLNAEYTAISIREQETRWGSCSSRGRLSYNWKIILAPENVFRYVIAHEVAHLVEHNHSDRFWANVFKLEPEYRDAKVWLKSHGHELRIG